MQTQFGAALAAVLQHEGGYVHHPHDPGGHTNKGVTLAVYRGYYGADKTVADLQAIPTGHVAHIYRDGYWNRCRCDELPAGVDYVVFDQAVNSGPLQSIKWLQTATGVARDGQLGPLTLAAVHRESPVILIQEMCRLRIRILQRLRNGTLWKHFGRGWRRRVAEVQATGIRMALEG